MTPNDRRSAAAAFDTAGRCRLQAEVSQPFGSVTSRTESSPCSAVSECRLFRSGDCLPSACCGLVG